MRKECILQNDISSTIRISHTFFFRSVFVAVVISRFISFASSDIVVVIFFCAPLKLALWLGHMNWPRLCTVCEAEVKSQSAYKNTVVYF